MKEPKSSRNGDSHPSVIYVVDDEPMLLELAAVILEPAGYVVQTFRNADEALKTFTSAKSPPALIITDYSMHTMNGLDLIAACRHIHPNQKFLMISGTIDEHVYRHSPWKPDHFLSKPYQAKELVDRVEALLAEGTR